MCFCYQKSIFACSSNCSRLKWTGAHVSRWIMERVWLGGGGFENLVKLWCDVLELSSEFVTKTRSNSNNLKAPNRTFTSMVERLVSHPRERIFFRYYLNSSVFPPHTHTQYPRALSPHTLSISVSQTQDKHAPSPASPSLFCAALVNLVFAHTHTHTHQSEAS
jgi:hypothetical protein